MRKLHRALIVAFFVLIFSSGSVNDQTAPTPTPAPTQTKINSEYFPVIENEDGKQVKLALADIGRLKRQIIKGNDHGREETLESFLLSKALKLGGMEFGETPPGKRLATIKSCS
ncbi:MAG TPA: hypothetical protein VF599_21460 [Pyrinomonadaceae bacterium]|jgi:hypothetical protein